MSIGVNGLDIGSGLVMRTEGTTGIADQSLDWNGDTITTVLLEGVGGGREDWGCEAHVGRAWLHAGVVIWRAGADRELGAEGWSRATQGSGLGAAVTGPEVAVPCFFFLGADTRFHAICLPNTTRTSPSCLSVPQIKMMHSEQLSASWVKAETRALEISVTCFRLWLLHLTTCPTRSSVITKEAEKWSGENSLGW